MSSELSIRDLNLKEKLEERINLSELVSSMNYSVVTLASWGLFLYVVRKSGNNKVSRKISKLI